MALIAYENTTTYVGDQFLSETFTQGQSTRNILAALGDYWTEYFTDQDLLKAAVSGAVTLYSSEYFRVLNTVLSSNVTHIPVEEPIRYGIQYFSIEDIQTHLLEDDTIVAYSFPVDDETSIEYLVSSLFDPEVVLEKDVHYSISEGRIYFIVDIFGDDAITRGAYAVLSGANKFILFWSMNTLVSSTSIYERFGTFLYDYDVNSPEYKSLVTALQFFYTQAKTVDNIRTIINVLYGIPYTRYTAETIISCEDVYSDEGNILGVTIVTDQTTYSIPPFCEVLVEVGDVVDRFTLLAYWHEVQDYKTDPDWYEGIRLPNTITSVEHPEFDINARAHKDGNTWEKFLYDLYDSTLKHNLVLLRTNLNFNNYEFFKGGAKNLYKIIRSGFPVYLCPVIEAIFYIDEYEALPNQSYETLGCTATLRYGESIPITTEESLDYNVVMPPYIESVSSASTEAFLSSAMYLNADQLTVIAADDLTVAITIHPIDLPTITSMGMFVGDRIKPPIRLTDWSAKRLFLAHALADQINLPTTVTTTMFLQSILSRNVISDVNIPRTYSTSMFLASIINRNEI